MRKLIHWCSRVLFTLTVICSMNFSAFADDWEGLREYMKHWVAHDGLPAVKSALGQQSSSPAVKKFINGSSQTSNTIRDALKSYRPDIYNFYFPKTAPKLAIMSSQPTSWPAPLPEDHQPFLTSGPFIVADPIQGPLQVTPELSFNPYIQCGIMRFNSLGHHFLPNLPLGSFYEYDPLGRILIQTPYQDNPQFSVRLYGPDLQGRFGWVSTNPFPQESYSRTLSLNDCEPRNSYPIKFHGLSGDISHMQDRIHAPYPWARFNSNRDWLNYVLGGSVYNQNMRLAITQKMGFREIREVLIYGNQTVPFRHRLTWNDRRNRWSTLQSMPLHQSSIFVCSSHSDQSVRTYFLPENDVGSSVSRYQIMYDSTPGTYADTIVPQFEVRRASHFLKATVHQPTMAGSTLSPNLEDFYMALNLYPYFSNVGPCLTLFRRAELPWGVNFALEWTAEEIRANARAIHSGLPISLPQRAMLFQNWNGLKYPKERESGDSQLVDASAEYVPQYGPAILKRDVMLFRDYVGRQRLKQLLSLPSATLKMKLMVAEAFHDEGKNPDAGDLLSLAYHQLIAEGDVKEALWFLDLSSQIFNEEHSMVIGATQYISALLGRAPLEDLIAVREFNCGRILGSLLPDYLPTVREISSRNSIVLSRGVLFYSYSQQINLNTILKLIENCDQVQIFSLSNIVFSAPNFWTAVDEWTEDGETVEHEMGVVSEDEYFWQYEKPLSRILSALSLKHGRFLKVLDLTNLTFGTYSEEERTSYITSNYLPQILTCLADIAFPELEVLNLTGCLTSQNATAIKIFERLDQCFPKLNKVTYSPSADHDSIELVPEDLTRVGRIFRSVSPLMEKVFELH